MVNGAAWEKFKRILVVVVVTVFIWLAADQYVRREQLFRIPVRVVSHDPDRYAAIAGDRHQVTLTVTMVGRHKHLKRFADSFGPNDFFEAVVDETRVDRHPQSVSTLNDILRRIKEIRESRLSIKSVSPPTVSIRIDEYEVIPNVAVEPDYGDLRVVNPVCNPDTVSVRIPRFATPQLLNERVIRPEAANVVQEATKGRSSFQEVPLPLTLEADPTLGIEIIPDQVTLSGVVEARNATDVKGPVQITFSTPNEVQEGFAIVANPDSIFRQSIEVTGPSEALERLDPRDIRGFVDVMAADMNEPGKEITRPVRYVLPPGFALAADSPTHEITFKLVPRAPAPTGN
jgi:hypothetical protein